MSNYQFYGDQQHYPEQDHGHYKMKPMLQTSSYYINPTNAPPSYNPIPSYTTHATTAANQTNSPTNPTDATLKHRIRQLKFLHRLLSALLSLATLIPLTLTLAKFLTTKDTYFPVNGVERTAWAAGTITWYTYLYFSVALVSFLLDAAVLLAYCCGGVSSANKAADVGGWWTKLTWAGQVGVWVASVAIYRYGKEPLEDGKFKDLWGWTCSPAARAIQGQVPNVDFDRYCGVQTASFYSGIVNVAAGLLSVVILVMTGVRSRSKMRASGADGAEPMRH